MHFRQWSVVAADTFSSARVLIRGIATIPQSLSERIATTRRKIDENEDSAAAKLPAIRYDSTALNASVSELSKLLTMLIVVILLIETVWIKANN